MLNIYTTSVFGHSDIDFSEYNIKTPSDFGCILSIQTSLSCYIQFVTYMNMKKDKLSRLIGNKKKRTRRRRIKKKTNK